jgi:hypothetical protein
MLPQLVGRIEDAAQLRAFQEGIEHLWYESSRFASARDPSMIDGVRVARFHEA